MRIQSSPRPRRVVRIDRECGSIFPWGRSPRCPPPTQEMLGQTPLLGPRDPVPNWHWWYPTRCLNRWGRGLRKRLSNLAGRSSEGCLGWQWLSCLWVPFEEVSEAPVPRLFQRLPTFDLENPVVNFKVCGEEEMSREHGSPSSGFLGV